MDKNLNELMQIRVTSENIELSKMIQDIEPIKEQRFTNLELETGNKHEFSVVIYKKQNPIIRLFNSIRFTFEKFKIMKHSNEFQLSKIVNKNQ